MKARFLAIAVWVLGAGCRGGDDSAGSLEARRAEMMMDDIRGRGVRDPAVLRAMQVVPRPEFVPSDYRQYAYDDGPLPIGSNQTISQPYMVAAMTELLRPGPGDVILEVGTGSGYQAAVLAEIVKHVYTIEIIPELGREAETRLGRLGYTNVTVKVGDGYLGWPDHAPFDGIVVTCGADEAPAPLIDQLKPGGRMVIPVGPDPDSQNLRLIEKHKDGSVAAADVMAVRFVPMTGKKGKQ